VISPFPNEGNDKAGTRLSHRTARPLPTGLRPKQVSRCISQSEDIRWGRREYSKNGCSVLYPSMGQALRWQRSRCRLIAWMSRMGACDRKAPATMTIYRQRATGIITRHLSHDILHGITSRRRAGVLPARHSWRSRNAAHELQRRKEADEAFNHSACCFRDAVVEIDGVNCVMATPGRWQARLRRAS